MLAPYFLRLPSASSREVLAPDDEASTPTAALAVPVVPAGEAFLEYVCPTITVDAGSTPESKESGADDSDEFGEVSTGKTGKMRTRNVKASKKRGEKAKKAKKEEIIDHYAVLGLGKWGPDSTQKQIKTAYHRAILKYHPDKITAEQRDAGYEVDKDPVFLAIQKAYETLSDETLRRGYDSQWDFDDSIPKGFEPKEEFFTIYEPVFRRNARFSKHRPVPQLGDKDTPAEGKNGFLAFYDFWHKFESWRDFSGFDEHNPNEAEDRFERRWMERENKNARAKRKKAEYKRIQTLVERAYKNDPRIVVHNKRMAAEHEAAKEQKRQEREAYKARIAAEKMAKEQVELDAKLAKERLAKEKQASNKDLKKKMKKLRRKWQKYCDSLGLDDDAGVERMVLQMGLEKGTAELARVQEENLSAEAIAQMILVAAEDEAAALAQKRAEQAAKAKKAAEEKAAAIVPWTSEELSMLIKATKKYPGGSQRRWQMIGEMVNALGLTSSRTVEECIAKAKEITNKQQNDLKRKNNEEAMEKYKKELARKAEKSISKDPKAEALLATTADKAKAAKAEAEAAAAAAEAAAARAAAQAEAAEEARAAAVEWSNTEKKLFDRAIRTFKASMNKTKRWEAIAEAVGGGKLPRDCKRRFRKLREDAAKEAKKEADKATEAIKRDKMSKKNGKTAKNAVPAGQDPPAAPAVSSGAVASANIEWSAEEQVRLEDALRTFPRTMDKKKRWKAIGDAVKSKSARECLQRFKEIRAIAAKARVATVSASSDANNVKNEEEKEEEDPVILARRKANAERKALEKKRKKDRELEEKRVAAMRKKEEAIRLRELGVDTGGFRQPSKKEIAARHKSKQGVRTAKTGPRRNKYVPNPETDGKKKKKKKKKKK
eukprot:g2720.t1